MSAAVADRAHRACKRFPGVESSVRTSRHWTAAKLRMVTPPLPTQVISDAALIISELGTNAILHTASGSGGNFAVTLEVDPAQVRMWVMDQGSDTIPIPRTDARDDEDECGRGLRIVEAFADECGPVITDEASGYTATIRIRVHA
ncbi:anti-sigma regulatory factor (Ser/Thr protein kinase) [Murinocardiopsis flavida]|uniref:Anti-sigma regulatory factor (Ser/Thr protein kinase) n=1 Tax=Murinocardiopsis flavida TaxID=645275 RepID=A0A2P8C6U3_9ACTN|nr:ATP-binding protein [Murinocardiopsis flavida]PSK80698.1 anti-sigma regulatory factor (Ser/Thr protein kinase) [Murinocardiopsis flavida]